MSEVLASQQLIGISNNIFSELQAKQKLASSSVGAMIQLGEDLIERDLDTVLKEVEKHIP